MKTNNPDTRSSFRISEDKRDAWLEANSPRLSKLRKFVFRYKYHLILGAIALYVAQIVFAKLWVIAHQP